MKNQYANCRFDVISIDCLQFRNYFASTFFILKSAVKACVDARYSVKYSDFNVQFIYLVL